MYTGTERDDFLAASLPLFVYFLYVITYIRTLLFLLDDIIITTK